MELYKKEFSHNHIFPVMYEHICKNSTLSENHIGKWGLGDISGSVFIFDTEKDAKLAADYLLLLPLITN